MASDLRATLAEKRKYWWDISVPFGNDWVGARKKIAALPAVTVLFSGERVLRCRVDLWRGYAANAENAEAAGPREEDRLAELFKSAVRAAFPEQTVYILRYRGAKLQ